MKKDWTYKKLGEVCSSDLGKTLNSKTDNGEYYPYLCAINVLWDRIDTTVLKTAKFEPSELERYSVKKGDLLVCEGGDVGRAAIWNDETVIQYQNALHRIRFKGEVIPRFCLFYLRHLKDNGTLDAKYAKGVTIKHLVKSSLLSIPIPIPPIKEQEEICTLLDKLSLVIEKKKQQVKELDNLAQAIFYDMFGDPIINDKGWQMKKLCEVGEIVAGSTPSTNDSENWDGDVNWVTPAELGKQLFYGSTQRKLTQKGSRGLTLMPVGTVLLSSRAPIGKLAITTEPMCCNQGFKNIICNDCINNIFLYHYLLYTKEKVQALGVGATFKEVSKKAISGYITILPPLPLQQSFAQKVESIERQKELINQSIREAQTLFDSRMEYYFGE